MKAPSENFKKAMNQLKSQGEISSSSDVLGTYRETHYGIVVGNDTSAMIYFVRKMPVIDSISHGEVVIASLVVSPKRVKVIILSKDSDGSSDSTKFDVIVIPYLHIDKSIYNEVVAENHGLINELINLSFGILENGFTESKYIRAD